MGSTLKNDTSKALFLERVAKSWDKVPNMSFGELLTFAIAHHIMTVELPSIEILAKYSNKELAEVIERYVLLHAKG